MRRIARMKFFVFWENKSYDRTKSEFKVLGACGVLLYKVKCKYVLRHLNDFPKGHTIEKLEEGWKIKDGAGALNITCSVICCFLSLSSISNK